MYTCKLSQEVQNKAEKELNETPEKRERALKRLRKSVEEFPGLTAPVDDRFLLKFLRARKFDEDRTLDLIVKYFRVRKENPDVFDNFRPSAIARVLEAGITSVLPDRDDDGRRVLLFRPDDFPLVDMFRTNLMTMELLIEEEETQVHGFQLVMDASQFGMRHASYVSPSYAKQVMSVIQEAFPARLKAINYVNEPTIIGYIFPMVRPFMKEKLSKRLHFHGQAYAYLHKLVPPRMLPVELGGTIENFNNKDWKTKLLSSENKFVEFEKYEIVEDTPGMKGAGMKNDALERMSGTFRKLDVD